MECIGRQITSLKQRRNGNEQEEVSEIHCILCCGLFKLSPDAIFEFLFTRERASCEAGEVRSMVFWFFPQFQRNFLTCRRTKCFLCLAGFRVKYFGSRLDNVHWGVHSRKSFLPLVALNLPAWVKNLFMLPSSLPSKWLITSNRDLLLQPVTETHEEFTQRAKAYDVKL